MAHACAEQVDENGCDGCTEDGGPVESAEPATAMHRLQESTEEPDRKEFKERAQHGWMDEAVGDGLPDLSG